MSSLIAPKGGYLDINVVGELARALRRSPLFRVYKVTSRAIPLLSNMEYKAATSRRPARAVGYPAQGRGADSDGGGTAGTPLADVVAASVSNSHKCEIPHPMVSKQSALGSNGDLPPTHKADQTSAPERARGRSPNGAKAESQAINMKLQNRVFKLATWNMCGQGTKTASNSREKMRFAEQLMSLEQIDILVLTETHTVSLPSSRRVDVLEQTGLASRAGVVILTKAGAGWDVLHKQVLILGHAIIVNVSHRVSRESFWILGVYGDISQGQVSLGRFLACLKARLTTFVQRQARTHWGGCFAIGDWNFVEHVGDRHPTGGSQAPSKKLITCFEDVKGLCDMRDVSGRGPAPRDWSYSKMTHNGIVYSRLDHIYRPTMGWRDGKVLLIATKWSDHRVIIATVYIKKPKVEKATPAPRLPNLEVLDKMKRFWPGVLQSWGEMTDSGPVTLEKWRSFKDEVLRIGHAEVTGLK